MHAHCWIAAILMTGAAAQAEPELSAPVRQCLSCHIAADGQLDIVGLRALEGLPEEWPFLFEDRFDLDGDGIAGTLRIVSGPDHPLVAKYGEALAAGRFEDFALIAAGAHDIPLSDPAVMAEIKAAFEARSPDPGLPFADDAARQRFEARGCAACHVTRSYTYQGRTYRPLSDFLLHDLGDGPKRTKPLWGCPECLEAPAHTGLSAQER